MGMVVHVSWLSDSKTWQLCMMITTFIKHVAFDIKNVAVQDHNDVNTVMCWHIVHV